MDPVAADAPCVIQALRAHPPSPSAKALALPLPFPHPSPPLVQALPAHHSPAKPHPPPAPAAASASSSSGPKRRAALPPTPPPPPPPAGPAPPSPRRTRSGGAPEWTRAETLALVAEVAAVDDGWSRSVSAFQKWAMVAENLASSEAFAAAGAPGGGRRRGGRGSRRAAGECRRRWEVLAAEYGAVRRWEVRTGGTYWGMGAAARTKAGLPAEFDAEVYGAMDALIRVEEAMLADAAGGGGGGGEEVEGLVGGGAGVEVGEQDGGGEEVEGLAGGGAGVEVGELEGGEAEVAEDEVQEDASGDEDEQEDEENADEEDGDEMLVNDSNADAPNDKEGCEIGTNSEPVKSQNDAWDLANKLHENAQHIHSILNEEAEEYAIQTRALGGLVSADAMEATRQKADELIKSLGGLVSYLNQFTELVKENGIETVIGMS